MGKIKLYPKVKLITSIFTNNLNLLDEAINCLRDRFGEIDSETDLLPFEFTKYYSKEFGTNLKRKIISFKELISADDLVSIKLYTNNLEEILSEAEQGKRKINLDPGYICTDKLILATTKDRSHRIYLGQGIFGEVTLKYTNGHFEPWKWTYKSYQSEDHLDFFLQVRKIYMKQLKEMDVAEKV
ncbi:MAG TPA: DUF4416 family protein [Clostridia bacterium]|jgi:hypothetical protein|nr:DUF4416 family protein [Clostridia bacterium]